MSSPANTALDIQPATAAAGNKLGGFLLSGFLLSLLGAILPAWGYYRDPADFTAVGNYFLSMAAGLALSTVLARLLLKRWGLKPLMVSACALSSAALVCLALSSPPAPEWWRAAGLLALGVGAGLLNTGLLHGNRAGFQAHPAATANRGGVWYGSGCMAATLMVAGTFYAYSVPVILLLMAAVPAIFGAIYTRRQYAAPGGAHRRPLRDAMRDFRSPGAVLFALVLFFQLGNEWSLAGWLPLFLIRRLGMSPKGALLVLALYLLFLMLGRLGGVAVLPRVRHGRLLAGSVAIALFGCLILFATKTAFGAVSATVFLGAGYASIFPLVSEAIGRRFPYFHPGLFSGIFSIGLFGGLLAPATLGYAADAWGVGVVVGIPLLGSCMVMLLVALLWLESKVTGR